MSLLRDSPGIGSSYRERFAHLLVDEFQDTNALQLALIEQLRGPDSRLFVVGDRFQAIYGFRHADIGVFNREEERFRERPRRRGALADRELPLAAGDHRRGQRDGRRDDGRLRASCPPGAREPDAADARGRAARHRAEGLGRRGHGPRAPLG